MGRVLGKKRIKSFFYPQLLKKETPLSLKLVQTSLAQTKIHRGLASPYPPPSPPLQAVMLHPPESAPQTPVGSLKTFLGRRRAVPSLPKSPYKGCSVARGPTLGPAPHQHEDLPCGAGILGEQVHGGGEIQGFPPKKKQVLDPLRPPAATRRSRGAASSRRSGCW